jgi:Zn-dependent protease with chaperone function
MITFEATYFDGKTAKPHAVQVSLDGPWLYVKGEVEERFAVNQCEITHVMGKVRRSIHLPGEAKLETQDLAAVAELERVLGLNKGMSLVNRFEQSWRWTLVMIVGIFFAGAAVVWWGIPLFAQGAAAITPPRILDPISKEALKQLDDGYLKPTRLSAARQAELQKLFLQVTRIVGKNYNYRLELRKGGRLGANAFALPSGVIIFTDEIIDLAQSDREIAAVMAHEVGHVVHRHSLRQLYQAVGITVMISAVFGDLSSAASMATTLPTVLIQTGYSRQFELQADATAARYTNAQGWGTEPLAKLLERLEASRPSRGSVLSTHPDTKDRIAALKRISKP